MHFTSIVALTGASFFAGNNMLYATCSNGHGGSSTSALNLNACIANYNGNLACAANGNYGSSCRGCLIHTGTYMRCMCSGGGSGIADLNKCVANRGGILACAT